jgi:tetratricopeptide (TPR) repeat protein
MTKKGIYALVVLMWFVAAGSPVEAASRKVRSGDSTPEFSVVMLSGDTYAYTPQSEKALMVVFLSAKQKNSLKAQTDLVRILGQISDSAEDLTVVIALDDPNAFSPLTSLESKFSDRMIVTLDQDHHLWGGFGAIAMPTVVIANPQGQVVCFEAGYGYNFARVVHAHLNQVLGVETDVTQAAMSQVSTVSNSTQNAKLSRLINAANMMAARGHYEAAISEMKRAQAQDPNSVEVVVSLAKLYCRASKGKEAIDALQGVVGGSRSQKAQILLVSGWAYRLTGDLDAALKSLLGATEQAPEEAQAFYELGLVYESKGLKDEALKAYRHALALLF